jgi:hypothetical protein
MGGRAGTVIKGYGRATIATDGQTVVKFGDGAKDQGTYAITLGPKVCPRVLSTFHNGYAMEHLSAPPSLELGWADIAMRKLVTLLITEVWNKDGSLGHEDWRERLIGWSWGHHRKDIAWLIEELYSYQSDRGRSVYTHGDPTLANVLYRGQDLVIADPLPPGDKIPSYREVDIAKVSQSVIGWEHVAHGWPYYGATLVASFTTALQYTVRSSRYEETNDRRARRVLFWLMVHLMRAKPYVLERGARSVYKVVKWLDTRISWIEHRLKDQAEVQLCDTLTTLTALSLTPVQRSTPPIRL